MFDIKILLQVVSLVIFTIICHAHACNKEKTQEQLECEEMIDNWFDKEKDGKYNFHKSFKFNSIPQLNYYLQESMKSSSAKSMERKRHLVLRHEINKSYLLRLFEEHKVDLKGFNSPNAWCGANAPYYKNDNCTNTIKDVLGIDGAAEPETIFKIMYENLSISEIENKYNEYIQKAENIYKFMPTNYPLKFFNYYAEKAEPEKLIEGKYDTYGEFCSKEGKDIVKEKENVFLKYKLS